MAKRQAALERATAQAEAQKAGGDAAMDDAEAPSTGEAAKPAARRGQRVTKKQAIQLARARGRSKVAGAAVAATEGDAMRE
jgi:hypothetical protein